MADSNYYHFDKWIMPILEEMLVEQNTKVCRLVLRFHAREPNDTFIAMATVVGYLWFASCQGVRWTPSKMIHRLGKEINNPESICYWAYKVSVVIGVKNRILK